MYTTRACFFIVASTFAFPILTGAQNQNANPNSSNGNSHWKVNGNSADTTKFIGTTNQADLILKTDGHEVVRFKTDSSTVFKGDVFLDKEKHFGNNALRYSVINPNGKVRGMERDLLISNLFGTGGSCIQFTDVNGNLTGYQAPIWSTSADNIGGILYTGDLCPARVGIGTSNPQAAFHITSAQGLDDFFRLGNYSITNPTSFEGLRYDKHHQLWFTEKNSLYSRNNGLNLGYNISKSLNGDFINSGLSNYTYNLFIGETGLSFDTWTQPLGSILGSSVSMFFIGNNAAGNPSVGIGTNNIEAGYLLDVVGRTSMDFLYIGGPQFGGSHIPVNNDDHVLFVNGSANFLEVWVRPSMDWPDYVFQTSYELMPLDSVENYISENGHLPNVPSAQEVEKNGIELGDGQAVLLRKLEELTLYIIELEKKQKALEAEIIELKK